MAALANRNGSLAEQVKAARDEALSMRGEAASIANDFRELMRLEMELARAEMAESRQAATRGLAFGAGTGFLSLIALLLLFLTIMFALDTALPLWAAALITTGIAVVLSLILGIAAKQQVKRLSPLPRRAIQSTQEDMSWARSQLTLKMK